MEKIYNTIIIGAGKIGAFFDIPTSENILTHAHAFSKLKGFNLVGFIDSNKENGEKAAELWNTKFFYNLEEVFENHEIDVVAVCVPDEYHYEILKKLSNYPIKIVFAEKPLTKTTEQAKEIISIYKEKNIKCIVNYSRRFVPEFQIITSEILLGKCGKFICGNGYYGKGTSHNGSHLIDLLRCMVGEIRSTESFDYNYDFYKDDPSVSAIIRFENGGIFTMLNVPCNSFTIFEIELIFEKKRIRIVDSGFKVEIYEVADSLVFKGYRNMIQTQSYNTTLGKAMENAVLNIYNYLSYEEKIKCTLEDGYRAMEICEKLKVEIK